MARVVVGARWRWMWRPLVALLTPLILAFIPALTGSSEARCGYVVVVMAVYWITEVVPLAATALVPVFAFPLLGLLSTQDVCLAYMKDTNIMFMGGLIMAVAVEHCNLHQRIALFVMLNIGQSPRLLMAGFMVTTTFLSMWISNTAAAAMIVPIVDAVVKELCRGRESEGRRTRVLAVDAPGEDPSVVLPHQSRLKLYESSQSLATNLSTAEDGAPQLELCDEDGKAKGKGVVAVAEAVDAGECEALRKMMFLSVAFAANIGGTGSPLGCGPNLVVMGILQSTFSEPTGLNFATWMLFNVPGMIINMVLAWCWLQLLYMGFRSSNIQQSNPERERAMKKFLEAQYSGLGRISQHELVVLVAFSILVFLWIFRAPGFVTGWAQLFDAVVVRDATPVMLVVFLLFVIPAKIPWSTDSQNEDDESSSSYEPCLTWQVIHAKVPWGVILLLGGGFAVADAAKVSGLSSWLGTQLQYFAVMPKVLLVFVVCLLVAMLTEVASNTATASVLLPVIKDLSLGIGVNPIYLMLPAAVCCAYAFMLPVATPGNAIILTAAKLNTLEMMRAGMVMNIVCVVVITIMINTLGVVIFDVHNLPAWVNSTTSLA